MVMLILATDMARHNEILEAFKSKCDNFDFSSDDHLNSVSHFFQPTEAISHACFRSYFQHNYYIQEHIILEATIRIASNRLSVYCKLLKARICGNYCYVIVNLVGLLAVIIRDRN